MDRGEILKTIETNVIDRLEEKKKTHVDQIYTNTPSRKSLGKNPQINTQVHTYYTYSIF